MTAATLEAPTGPPPTRPVTTTEPHSGYLCTHCGMVATGVPIGVHLTGSYAGKSRCGSESGMEYGYNAHPEGTACINPCLGVVR